MNGQAPGADDPPGACFLRVCIAGREMRHFPASLGAGDNGASRAQGLPVIGAPCAPMRLPAVRLRSPDGPASARGPAGACPQPHCRHVPRVPRGPGEIQGGHRLPEQAAPQQEEGGGENTLRRPPAGERRQAVQQAEHPPARREVRPVPGREAPAGQGDQEEAVQQIQPGDEDAGGGVPPKERPFHQKKERISSATTTAPTTPQKPMPSRRSALSAGGSSMAEGRAGRLPASSSRSSTIRRP